MNWEADYFVMSLAQDKETNIDPKSSILLFFCCDRFDLGGTGNIAVPNQVRDTDSGGRWK